MYHLIQNLSILMRFQGSNMKAVSDKRIIEVEALKVLYLPGLKVECFSIKRVIENFLEIEMPNNRMNIHRANFLAFNRLKSDKNFSLLKFSFAIKSWGRLASCYPEKLKSDKVFISRIDGFTKGIHKGLFKYKILEINMPFSEFSKAAKSIPDERPDQYFHSQYTFLSDISGKLIADYIGKLENFRMGFNYIIYILIVPLYLVLLQPNKTHHNYYRKYFIDDLLTLSQKRCSQDISIFNYNF